MDAVVAVSPVGVLLQVLFLDLLLSGDNALVIALACRRLPPEQARRAAWLGAAGAILFRLVLTVSASALMMLPFLQLLSAAPLLLIALNMMSDSHHPHGDSAAGLAVRGGLVSAAAVIILSDAVMSVDNVMALAAVSAGRFWPLAFGLACSVPLIVFGSFGFRALMRHYPLLIDAGAAMLGWVAGQMMVGDPVFAGWVERQAPALNVAVPLACAIFILAQGRMERRRKEQASRAAPFIFKPLPPVLVEPVAPAAIMAKAKVAALAVAAPKEEPKDASSGEPQAEASVAQRFERAVVEAASELFPEEAEEPVEPGEESRAGDRWMVLGLIGLFSLFGIFLFVAIMIAD
jgi:YjbE family integral membrane protein